MNCKQLICLKGNYNFGCHVHAIFVALIHTSIQRFSLFWSNILLPECQMLFFFALQKKYFTKERKIIKYPDWDFHNKENTVEPRVAIGANKSPIPRAQVWGMILVLVGPTGTLRTDLWPSVYISPKTSNPLLKNYYDATSTRMRQSNR